MWWSPLLEVFPCFWDAGTEGKAVQLPQGNYLGLVSSVQPEWAKGWRVSNRSLVDSGHHLHSQVQLLLVPLPYSSPVTTPGLTEKLLCLSPLLSTNCGLQLPSFHPSLSQSLQEVKTIRTLFHGSPWVRAFTSTFAFFLSISPNSERSRSLEVALGCWKTCFTVPSPGDRI